MKARCAVTARLVGCALLSGPLGAPVHAQAPGTAASVHAPSESPPSAGETFRASGVSLGLVGDGLVTAAWRRTSRGAGGFGWNAAIGTLPQAFMLGVLPVLAEAGPALGVPFGDGAVFFGASLGPIVAAGPGGAALAVQVAFGGTLIVDFGEAWGARVDYSAHRVLDRHANASIRVLELGATAVVR